MKKITTDNFNKVIKGLKRPYIIKFSSQTCAPCAAMIPVMEQLAKTRTDLTILEVDIDRSYDLAAYFNVRSVPTILICHKREVLYQFTGITPKGDIEFVLDNLDDPHFRRHGEFRVEKKQDYALWGAIGVTIAVLLGLFIYVINFY